MVELAFADGPYLHGLEKVGQISVTSHRCRFDLFDQRSAVRGLKRSNDAKEYAN